MPSRGLLWAVKSTLPALLYSHGGTPDIGHTGQFHPRAARYNRVFPPSSGSHILTFSADLFVTKL